MAYYDAGVNSCVFGERFSDYGRVSRQQLAAFKSLGMWLPASSTGYASRFPANIAVCNFQKTQPRNDLRFHDLRTSR